MFFVPENVLEQQGLQLRPVPAGDRERTAVRGDLRGYRGEVSVWSLPVPRSAEHAAGCSLLRLRSQLEGRAG